MWTRGRLLTQPCLDFEECLISRLLGRVVRERNKAPQRYQGGLAIDSQTRVLDAKDRPFPNLFAAGGAAVGVSGSKASGYLSGNGLLTATVFGRIAGQAAARL